MFLARSLWPRADFYLLTWDKTQASAVEDKQPLTVELETAAELINFKRVVVYPDTLHPAGISNMTRVLFFYQEAARLAAMFQYTSHVLLRPDLLLMPVKPLTAADLDCGDGIGLNVTWEHGWAGDQICLSSRPALSFFENILDRVCDRYKLTPFELSQHGIADKADIHTLLFEELQLQQVKVTFPVNSLYGEVICRYDYEPEPFSLELCRRVTLDTERWWLTNYKRGFNRRNFHLGKKMLFPGHFQTGTINTESDNKEDEDGNA